MNQKKTVNWSFLLSSYLETEVSFEKELELL